MKFRSHAKILVIALLTLCSVSIFAQSPKVAVESIGMTVSDMDRSVEFYSAGFNTWRSSCVTWTRPSRNCGH